MYKKDGNAVLIYDSMPANVGGTSSDINAKHAEIGTQVYYATVTKENYINKKNIKSMKG